MTEVTELRVALTVADVDEALAFYRDALGLEQIADWSSGNGRVVVLGAGRATLELFDEAQAELVDAIEAGRRVSGAVRLAFEVPDSEELARRLATAGGEQIAPPVTTPGRVFGSHMKAGRFRSDGSPRLSEALAQVRRNPERARRWHRAVEDDLPAGRLSEEPITVRGVSDTRLVGCVKDHRDDLCVAAAARDHDPESDALAWSGSDERWEGRK